MIDLNALAAAHKSAKATYEASMDAANTSRGVWIEAQKVAGVYEGTDTASSTTTSPVDFVSAAKSHAANVTALTASRAAFKAAALALSEAVAASST